MTAIKIPLGRTGLFALVSPEDAERLRGYRWSARKAKNGRMYAQVTISMHSFLMGKEVALVDHIDGDGLNNQRDNLRPATRSQNSQNRGKTRKNTSGFKGVTWCKQSQKWRAQIEIGGGKVRKGLNLGLFENKADAARTYDSAAKLHFGEFARLNFPEG